MKTVGGNRLKGEPMDESTDKPKGHETNLNIIFQNFPPGKISRERRCIGGCDFFDPLHPLFDQRHDPVEDK